MGVGGIVVSALAYTSHLQPERSQSDETGEKGGAATAGAAVGGRGGVGGREDGQLP